MALTNVRFDSTTGQYAAEVVLRNTGQAIGHDLVVLFPDLPAAVTAPNASGTDAVGNPYINMQPAIAPGGLGAGEMSDPVQVEFNNNAHARLVLRPQVLVRNP